MQSHGREGDRLSHETAGTPAAGDVESYDTCSLCEGRYLLVELLAGCPTWSTYRCWDVDAERWRHLALVHPSASSEERAALGQWFEAFRSPYTGISPVLDVGEEAGFTFAISELAEGGDLDTWLRLNGPMPGRMAVELAMDVGDVLEQLRSRGARVIEGGLTGVRVTLEGDVRVTTGLSCVSGEPLVAPEAAGLGEADERAAVYLLGAILFVLVTGEPPSAVMSVRAGALSSSVPPLLVSVIQRAVSFHPEERVPSLDRMVAILRATQRSLPPVPLHTAELVMEPSPPWAVPNPLAYPPITTFGTGEIYGAMIEMIDDSPGVEDELAASFTREAAPDETFEHLYVDDDTYATSGTPRPVSSRTSESFDHLYVQESNDDAGLVSQEGFDHLYVQSSETDPDSVSSESFDHLYVQGLAAEEEEETFFDPRGRQPHLEDSSEPEPEIDRDDASVSNHGEFERLYALEIEDESGAKSEPEFSAFPSRFENVDDLERSSRDLSVHEFQALYAVQPDATYSDFFVRKGGEQGGLPAGGPPVPGIELVKRTPDPDIVELHDIEPLDEGADEPKPPSVDQVPNVADALPSKSRRFRLRREPEAAPSAVESEAEEDDQDEASVDWAPGGRAPVNMAQRIVAFASGRGKMLLLAIGLVGIELCLILGSSYIVVQGAERASGEAWLALDEALAQEEVLIGNLNELEMDTDALAEAWQMWRGAEGPERQAAASQVVQEVGNLMDSVGGGGSVPWTVRRRAQRLRSLEAVYQTRRAEWRAICSAGNGQYVVSLGLASPPPP